MLWKQPILFPYSGGDSIFTGPSGDTKIHSMTIKDGRLNLDNGCLVIGE
jgi:hypothetical protein